MAPDAPGGHNLIDTTRPNPARVRDHLLGGKDTFQSDRAEADRLEAAFPPPPEGHLPVIRQMAVRQRQFTEKAAVFTAGQGVTQFVVLAAGLPLRNRLIRLPAGPGGKEPAEVTLRDVHDAVRVHCPDARAIYVDDDPVAASHLATLTGGPGVSTIHGDPAEPASILAAAAGLPCGERIDFTRPVAVIMTATLHRMPAASARRVTAAYITAMAPGSYLVLSCPRVDPPDSDPGLWDRLRGACTTGDIYNHTAAQVESFFGQMTLINPGVVPARGWNGGWTDYLPADAPAFVLCGLGLKEEE